MRQRWCIALRLPVQLRANNQEDGLKAIDSLILEQLSDILDCSTELLLFGEIRESLNINDLSYEQQKVVYDLAMMLKQYNKENENGLR